MAATGQQPARALPLLYFGAAHVALGLACLFAACWPQSVAGFFYHPWLIGLVHLVTLGWITFSILGAMYIVGPLALRMDLPARRLDYLAFAAAFTGLVGMVGHFWIEAYAGMAWSAGTIASAVVYMTVRIVASVRRARIQPAVKLHVILACVNFWAAATMGILIAVDKVDPILPGFVLSHVFAHAHLAALGWATMMVMGVGYRLLPMVFPAKMPPQRSMYASAALLESGVAGLFVTLLAGSGWAALFGVAIVAGLIAFAAHVVWMRRHLAPKPAGAPAIDFSVLHAAGAALWLAVAAVIGLVLLVAPASPLTLDAAAAYGVLGLVGFLAQMIVAMESRLLPMVTWFWAYRRTGDARQPPAPYAMRDRRWQAIVFAAWTVGVPALALGMSMPSASFVRAGASALFVGVASATIDHLLVLRHAIGRRAVLRRVA